MAAMTPEMRTALLMLAIIACGAFVVATTARLITKFIFVLVVVVLLNVFWVINIEDFIPGLDLSMDKSIVEVLKEENTTYEEDILNPNKEYTGWASYLLDSLKDSTD